MEKPTVIKQIEEILGLPLSPAPIREEDPLGGLIAYKNKTPKYALREGKLIGLNLDNTGLTDEQWKAIMDLEEFKPKDIVALNLWKNKLTAFKSEWGFTKLSHLDLADNPLVSPPEEITSKGNAAILNFLKELEEGDVVVYEAKLLIIGESGAGKTTLARKLCDPDAKMPEDKDTTKGIEVEPHLIKETGKNPFTMHIWDFGGQAIYHSTHQFFLSKRSLYVLVLDGRIEEDPHYWLRIQDLLGEDSPILILLNKKGEIRQQLAFQELLAFYTNIKKPLSFFSLKSNKIELRKFRKLISDTIRNLPHFIREEKVPRKWADIRHQLKELAKESNYISLEKFREICTDAGIGKKDRQDFLSDFLHSLGAILHFSQIPLLRKIVILNPGWATNAVYKVLDHTREHARVTGHFHKEELDEIWKEGGYNGVFDEMLTLMERFELCYALPNSPNEFIVPQLLSPDKPSYNWDDINQIRLHYRYTFMPKGIVTRLIVRLNRLIVDQKTVWQRGVVFEYEGAQAEVSELYHNRYIHIKSKGINRKALMTIITHQIDEINSTFDFDEQLKVSQLIPCNCTTCKQAESPYFFPKEVLNKAMSVGRKNLQCQDSFDGVSIRELFYDTFDREVIEHEEEAYPKGRELTKHEYHFHGPVDSVIPYNQGNIIQQFDHRTLIQELKPFKQLIEAEKEVGYISREEYEDLIDILAEIQETPDPKEGQKRRWKRWLGTAATSVSNFIKGRFEKGTDTVIQEEVKAWLKEGGLEKLMELISSF